MANQQTQTQPPAAPVTGGSNDATLTEEQRIAQQRLRDLEQQASDAARDSSDAKRELAGVKGELDRAKIELAASKAENDRLRQQLQATQAAQAKGDKLPAIPIELPKGAFQLVESVVFATAGADGKPTRADAKRGDIVVAGKFDAAAELQARIGSHLAVYAVDRDTLDELRALRHLA